MEQHQDAKKRLKATRPAAAAGLAPQADEKSASPAAAWQRVMGAAPSHANPTDILTLQRAVGNRTLQQWATVQRNVPPPPTAESPGVRSEEIARQTARYRTTTMAGYVRAVQALEAAVPQYTPRQILAALRQIYYGRPWSESPTEQWRDVLPQSPDMPFPRTAGVRGLFYALQQSQVVDGTDVGHFLTGLEALLNPTRQVELEIPGPNFVVNMPNTEFATWGGDLGSAAGQAVADRDFHPPARNDRHYFSELASDADLKGNIDAFVAQSGAAASGGLAAMLGQGGPPRSGTPVSEIFRQYYLTPDTALGRAHANRYRTFVGRLGGKVSGRTVTNRDQLIFPIAHRVSSFAQLWYAREYRRASVPGVGAAGAARILFSPSSDLTLRLLAKSVAMVGLFFDWLQARL